MSLVNNFCMSNPLEINRKDTWKAIANPNLEYKAFITVRTSFLFRHCEKGSEKKILKPLRKAFIDL